ncbi:tyrosine-protein phosphatase non-receptor type 2 [Eurytemora carolleeae]|uniref:tyrosine-protein phosphatase non-receptor type 2 n=1 Tax=Eurytemora carolleeae TaxID=1294199 RepID=UPI000C778527|nr:tyrosine-protein phosphatase non-receptor type 2 [Eurytemora carolleeae]|eukprot:XP_023327788.1 tyrosine-protein phosphatase non-receptor type 2-like [Eurytemora affinis]
MCSWFCYLVLKCARDITQLQYINWPDFNVPESPDTFLDFLQIVRNTECFDEESGPPVIHCSAGIGRSGTFCLVDSSLVLAAKGKHLNIQIIRSILLNMRTQRMGLIQTEDQLRFSVSAIIVGCSRMTASEVVVNGSGSKTDSESADRPAGKRLSVSSHSPPSSKKRKNSDS